MDKLKHNILESSAFFQGYVDQIFSQNKISFKVSEIFSDDRKIRDLNIEKYRRTFASAMNKLIEERAEEGYEATKINNPSSDLKIAYPYFVKDSESEDSGIYEIYPRTAICEKCHTYIRLDKQEDFCDCHAKLLQFTFVAFCDECGAYYPIDTMSNLRNDCKKCGLKNGLRKLVWKQSDDLGSYRVKCVRCGDTQGLYLKKCDHMDHQTQKRRSKSEKCSFRGVPARAGVLSHPLVLTLSEVPIMGEAAQNDRGISGPTKFSEGFNYFFEDLSFDTQEALFYFPEFWNRLKDSALFWSQNQVIIFAREIGLDPSTIDQWSYERRVDFIQGLINEAVNRWKFTNNREKVLREYGINEIHELLRTIGNQSFQEKELQGMSLLLAKNGEAFGPDQTIKRNTSAAYNIDGGDYPRSLGISEMAHLANLNITQALLGIIEGSARRKPQLYRVIKDKLTNKPLVYVRKMLTEGVYFKLESGRILKWLNSNGLIQNTSSDENIGGDSELRNLILSDNMISSHVYKLLHTFSHALIQSSSISTGLESQSISEMIFPSEGIVLLYSTNSVNVGGLEYTYDHSLYEWLSRVEELSAECPQDPGCMIDEGGACNACMYIPEFVCEKFNEELDRSSLIGGSSRYETGFFRK